MQGTESFVRVHVRFSTPRLVSLAMAVPFAGQAGSALAHVGPLNTEGGLSRFDLRAYEGSVEKPRPAHGTLAEPMRALPVLALAEAPDVRASAAPAGVPSGEAVGRQRQRDGLTLAAGIISSPSYSGSDSNVLIPAAAIRARVNGYAISTGGANISLDLVREWQGDHLDIKFGPVASLRSERTGRIRDVQVRALGKLGRAIEVGGYAGVSKTGVFTSAYDQIGARLTALVDVSGTHKSVSLSPTVEYGTPLSRTTFVGVQASASLVGKSFGRYYYDITPAGSAASGLPVYAAAGKKAGLAKYSLGLAAAQSLSGDLRKGWALLAGVQYSRMQGRYARSPIVSTAGKRGQLVFGVGIGWSV